jgi:hypothetical protein
VPPTYPLEYRVMTIVRRPVLGPNVAMKAVLAAPIAPKQNITAIAWLIEDQNKKCL